MNIEMTRLAEVVMFFFKALDFIRSTEHEWCLEIMKNIQRSVEVRYPPIG